MRILDGHQANVSGHDWAQDSVWAVTNECGVAPMNILLFSMPDSFEHMPPIAIRMPNGALTSLAGNVDPHHRVAAADLLLVQNRVRETVERLFRGT